MPELTPLEKLQDINKLRHYWGVYFILVKEALEGELSESEITKKAPMLKDCLKEIDLLAFPLGINKPRLRLQIDRDKWRNAKTGEVKRITFHVEAGDLKQVSKHGKSVTPDGILDIFRRRLDESNNEFLAQLDGLEASITETMLLYDTVTGKFAFKGKRTESISKRPGTRKRSFAIKLMKRWKKNKTLSWKEIVEDMSRKIPQGVYDDMHKIRKALETIGVNMSEATAVGYPPPSEPLHFSLVKKMLH